MDRPVPPSSTAPAGPKHQLVLAPETSRSGLALQDFVDGLAQWRLWLTMAWNDIRMRYRRSVLGPFWLTLSMGFTVGMMGVLYGTMFKIDLHTFLPFLCLGLLVWTFIQGVVNEGCIGFIASENFIKQIRLPYTIFVYRLICRNAITFAHNFLVYIVVAFVFDIEPRLNTLWIVPGAVLIVVNSVWIALLLGIICTRFRDVPPLVTSLLQVMFFVTPIMWVPKLLGPREYLAELNPGFHFVELMRAPLLGNAPTANNWLYAGAVTVLGYLVTFLMFRRYRNRIAFWL